MRNPRTERLIEALIAEFNLTGRTPVPFGEKIDIGPPGANELMDYFLTQYALEKYPFIFGEPRYRRKFGKGDRYKQSEDDEQDYDIELEKTGNDGVRVKYELLYLPKLEFCPPLRFCTGNQFEIFRSVALDETVSKDQLIDPTYRSVAKDLIYRLFESNKLHYLDTFTEKDKDVWSNGGTPEQRWISEAEEFLMKYFGRKPTKEELKLW
ncbi:MAG: hypothetical protein HYX24_04245 [Candidatus Aenigmarchaeota archaeon]|nr:hypothetical protein [Candidatus Aenigmarchaeota archaeon]